MWLNVGLADESLNRVQGVSQTFLGSGTVKKDGEGKICNSSQNI